MSETTSLGHNSGQVDASHLRAFVERIQRMNEEIKALNDDKKDIYAEAKGNGFDVKTLKAVVAICAQDRGKRQEEQSLLDVYLSALGMA
jgi:uncharacterized protein (UPF0335 family)